MVDDGNASQPPEDGPLPGHESYKVGPGKPPLEHRWKKGMKSPNPNGRPKSSRKKGLLASLDPATARFLELDRQKTGVFDKEGNELSFGESVMVSVQRRALTNGRMAEIYLRLKTAAEMEEKELKIEMLGAAVEHKNKWLDEFNRAEARGWPLPRVLPDPRDIIITPDGSVKIDGPVTIEQARALERALQTREDIYNAMKTLGRQPNREFARQLWFELRRKVYRLHPVIPMRLRLPMPPFDAPNAGLQLSS